MASGAGVGEGVFVGVGAAVGMVVAVDSSTGVGDGVFVGVGAAVGVGAWVGTGLLVGAGVGAEQARSASIVAMIAKDRSFVICCLLYWVLRDSDGRRSRRTGLGWPLGRKRCWRVLFVGGRAFVIYYVGGAVVDFPR